MRWSFIIAVAAGLLSLAFLSLAWAGGAPPDPLTDPGWYVSALRGAIAAKAWAPLLGIVVLVVVALLRWQRVGLVGKLPWLATRSGGWALNIVVALLGALGPALYSGVGWREVLRCLVTAVWAALGAAGVIEAVKDRLAVKPTAPAQGRT